MQYLQWYRITTKSYSGDNGRGTLKIRSDRLCYRVVIPDCVRQTEMSRLPGQVEIGRRQAVRLLCLAHTQYAFQAVLTDVGYGMGQQRRLADEDHQYQKQAFPARHKFHTH